MNIEEYGSGFPLVLFHGWGFDSQIWTPVIPNLKQAYHLYCVDLPGFGKTKWMDWPLFQAQLLSLLPEKFAIAGWSLGGLYASRLALENPDRITHLVNIASSPHFRENQSWPGVKAEVLALFHTNLSRDPEATLLHFQSLQKYSPIPPPGMPASKVGLESGLEILHHWDLRNALTDFKKPVCYMFGRLDAIIPANTLIYMQQLYPEFNYVLFKKSAHIPFLSESTLFIEALRAFLDPERAP